jgi:hypothetical protein
MLLRAPINKEAAEQRNTERDRAPLAVLQPELAEQEAFSICGDADNPAWKSPGRPPA